MTSDTAGQMTLEGDAPVPGPEAARTGEPEVALLDRVGELLQQSVDRPAQDPEVCCPDELAATPDAPPTPALPVNGEGVAEGAADDGPVSRERYNCALSSMALLRDVAGQVVPLLHTHDARMAELMLVLLNTGWDGPRDESIPEAVPALLLRLADSGLLDAASEKKARARAERISERSAVSGEQPDPEPLTAHGSPLTCHLTDKALARKLVERLDVEEVARRSYYTPPEAVHAIVPRIAAWFGERWPRITVLEPTAGDGAILRAMVEPKGPREPLYEDRSPASVNPARMTAVEVRGEERAKLVEQKFGRVVIGDFMDEAPGLGFFDLIASNPPFNRWQEVWHAAWPLVQPGGMLAMLMRGAMVEGKGRYAFWKAHPCDYHILDGRVSFVESGKIDQWGYAWYLWKRPMVSAGVWSPVHVGEE